MFQMAMSCFVRPITTGSDVARIPKRNPGTPYDLEMDFRMIRWLYFSNISFLNNVLWTDSSVKSTNDSSNINRMPFF